MASQSDCLSCGACCHGDDGWIHVAAVDDAIIETSPLAVALVVEKRTGGFVRRSLRMVNGVCAGLERSPGREFCTIYESRPGVCREFEAGSPDCDAARRRRGIVD